MLAPLKVSSALKAPQLELLRYFKGIETGKNIRQEIFENQLTDFKIFI